MSKKAKTLNVEPIKRITFKNQFHPFETDMSAGFFYIRTRKEYPHKWWLSFQCQSKNKIKQESVPKHLYYIFGLSSFETVEQARTRITEYNFLRKSNLKSDIQQIRAFKRYKEVKKFETIFTDASLIFEFEEKVIQETLGTEKHKKRLRGTVKNMCAMLIELKVLPYQYKEMSSKIVDYFIQKKYSVSYCYDLISLLNKWGLFLHKKTGVTFEPFGKLSGISKSKIRESQEDKGLGVRRASMPLTEEVLNRIYKNIHLKKFKDNLADNKKMYNFLLLCFAFGLRPHEADLFLEDTQNIPKKDKSTGMKYLEIEQTKLVGLSKEEKTKRIAYINKYQLEVDPLFQDKKNNFLRPEAKWVDMMSKDKKETYSNTQVFNNYAPRKGFVDENKETQSILSLAAQMGHKNINTTFKAYKNKNSIDFDRNEITDIVIAKKSKRKIATANKVLNVDFSKKKRSKKVG